MKGREKNLIEGGTTQPPESAYAHLDPDGFNA